MPERANPPSIPLHFSDFDFDVATLEVGGYGDDDLHKVQNCFGGKCGKDCSQQHHAEAETLDRSLRQSSAPPCYSDFDFKAAFVEFDDNYSRQRAVPHSTGFSEPGRNYGLADAPHADNLCLDASDQLATDKSAAVGFESDLSLSSNEYDEISQVAQVVPDQEYAYNMLEEIVFGVGEENSQPEDVACLESWIGDILSSEPSDWLSFEQVTEMSEYQDSEEKQDDLLHSSDWAMLEDRFAGRDSETGSASSTYDHLHSSDWAVLADNFSQGHLECSQDHHYGNIEELQASQSELEFLNGRDFARGQTDGTTPKDTPEDTPAVSEAAATAKLCRLFMTTSPQPREWVLEKLEMMACQVLEDLALGRSPEIELSSRTRAEAIVYDDENGVVRRLQDRSPFDEIVRSPSSPVHAANNAMEKPSHTKLSQTVECE
ncbi:hypothetical protein EC968_002855 [Mortierella alpina]|nr:hypothetical protein EC968_002855 [Mortierella alpina]